ncbi:MAG TPA: hypothetical protein VD902_04240 [Symbiobacteriaceae bacterium]|nr:hypothetical protein [Symbiobacteriaceae bacterium]
MQQPPQFQYPMQPPPVPAVAASARWGLILGIIAIVLQLVAVATAPSWAGSVTWSDLSGAALFMVLSFVGLLVALSGIIVSVVGLAASFQPGRNKSLPWAVGGLLLSLVDMAWILF